MNYREMLLEELEDDLYDDYDYDYDDYYDEDYLLEGLNDKDKYKAYVKKCRQNGKRPKSYEQWANTRTGLAIGAGTLGTAAVATVAGKKILGKTSRDEKARHKYEVQKYTGERAAGVRDAVEKGKNEGRAKGIHYAKEKVAAHNAQAQAQIDAARKAASDEIASAKAASDRKKETREAYLNRQRALNTYDPTSDKTLYKSINRHKKKEIQRSKPTKAERKKAYLDNKSKKYGWTMPNDFFDHGNDYYEENYDPFIEDFGLSFYDLVDEGFDPDFLLYEDVDTVANAIDIYFDEY